MRRARSRHVGTSVLSGATTPNRNGLVMAGLLSFGLPSRPDGRPPLVSKLDGCPPCHHIRLHDGRYRVRPLGLRSETHTITTDLYGSATPFTGPMAAIPREPSVGRPTGSLGVGSTSRTS